MGHPQVEYITSQSLEAIMPTTDPLFLLGYTIIIHILVLCFGESAVVGFLVGMKCAYDVDTVLPKSYSNNRNRMQYPKIKNN
jgi:hypothetical protein